jgi:hypothetical protein
MGQRTITWTLAICALFLWSNTTMGSRCITVASGDLLAPETWDCGCSVATCDSLVIMHSVAVDIDVMLSGLRYLEVTATGDLIANARLEVAGSIVLDGQFHGQYVRFLGPGNFTNSGSIDCITLITTKDTATNTGHMLVTDSLVVGVYRRMFNYSKVSTSVLYSLGVYGNMDTTITERTISTLDVYSYGVFIVNGLLRTSGYFSNYVVLEADTIQLEQSAFNSGSIRCRGTMFVGDPPSNADLGIDTDGAVFTKDLIVLEGSQITGSGDLCITDHSENHGSLLWLLNICDATPTLTSPPYLDVNTGTFASTLNYCAGNACSTVGISETSAPTALQVYPNPTSGSFTLTLPHASVEPFVIELFDPLGHRVRQSSSLSGTITIECNGLSAGLYSIFATSKSGEHRYRSSIVIAP